jgi:hypothetical protein
LIKTDSTGTEQWSQVFFVGGYVDKGYSVQQTSDDGYIITGYTGLGDPTGMEAFLIKTDESGNEQWCQTYGGSFGDCGYSVQQTGDGGYIVAGYISLGTGSNQDLYILKTDASGIEQWSQTLGGSGDDYGKCIRQTSDGGYIAVGFTNSYGAGRDDIWLIRLGNEVGVKPQNQNYAYEYILLPAYPNPFNPSTIISFALPEAVRVNLSTYDVSGRLVIELVDGMRQPGGHEVTFDGSYLASGIYIYNLNAGDYTASGKMVLMK